MKNNNNKRVDQQALFIKAFELLTESGLTYAEIYGILGLLHVSVGNMYVSQHAHVLQEQQSKNHDSKDVPSYVG